MRSKTTYVFFMAAGFAFVQQLLSAQDQNELRPPTPRELAVWIPDAVERELTAAYEYAPVVELYTQEVAQSPDLDDVAIDDDVYLGRLSFNPGPQFETIPLYTRVRGHSDLSKNAAGRRRVSADLAAVLFPDVNGMDTSRYGFTLAGYDRLDGLKTLVVDVRPTSADGFTGRLWLDDSQLALVRFSGRSLVLDKALSQFLGRRGRFHVESWRSRVADGQWVPATAYVLQQIDGFAARQTRLQMFARAWGYERSARKLGTFTDVVIDSPVTSNDSDGRPPTPIQSTREHRRYAEANILSWLTERSIIAPPSELDRTVCEIPNQLLADTVGVVEEPLSCRTLLVSAVDVIVIGRTILTSRSTLDAALDSASMSRIYAHFLGHLLRNNSIDPTLAFASRVMRPDAEILSALRRTYDASEEDAADRTAVKLLNASVYQNRLANSVLFMEALAAHAPRLTALLPPAFMDHMSDRKRIVRTGLQVTRPPVFDPERSALLLARPLGSRVTVDAWSATVQLLPIPSDRVGPRERLTFAITPLRPYVGRNAGAAAERH